MNNLKIQVTKDQPLEDIVRELERLGVNCCNYSFDGKVRLIYVSEMCSTAFGAYKSTIDMDFLFTSKPTTLAELKEME